MSSRISRSVRSFSVRATYDQLRQSRRYRRLVLFIQRKPFTSFFAALGLLLFILIANSIISSLGKKEIKKSTPVKIVQTYTIGKTPTVRLQAQIQKNGVIKIVAQGAGIVNDVLVKEGDNVNQGQTLINLSTNYQGGNAPDLQAQLAGAQLKNVNDTYGLQKSIIGSQRDIATASAENTDLLRQVSKKSQNDTESLLNSNRSQLTLLTTQIDQLQQTDPTNPSLPALKSQQAQLQSGVAQLQSAFNSLDYQTNTNNPPTLLAHAQEDITLKQLGVQEKALDLNKQVSSIQYNLALVSEALMHPASPFTGTVQRVNVQIGENVNPGTVIATIASSNITTAAILRAPVQIASNISRAEPSVFTINNRTISIVPSYVSTVATDGQLYSIIYNFPDGVTSLSDGEYIEVNVPVGYATSNVNPFVPIDSVYESQEESSVLVFKNGKAETRKVTLGDVYGQYVQVLYGLTSGDNLILNRNIVAGDTVQIIR